MKKILLSIVFIIGLVACKKKATIQAPVNDLTFQKAESFLHKNNDSAFFYFNKITSSTKDSLNVAMAFNYMALIQSYASDYFGAQESLLSSLKFLNENKQTDLVCLASDYNELAANSFNLKNYDEALNYYDMAVKFSKNEGFKCIILNNKALVYRSKKDYGESIRIYDNLFEGAKKNQTDYARALSNLAKVKWLKNPKYNAQAEFLKALDIRERENDEWGQNASFSHLADYYASEKPGLALIYAHKMYEISKKLASPDDQLEALQKLIKLSNPVDTKHYFEVYRNLDDSLQTARRAAKNQFALIRYEAEKRKVDNLKLQKDNTDKEYQITKQKIGIFALFILIVVVTVISIIWAKKKKLKILLESENLIRENQLKTSKKVHDVVANGLYRVMAEIENHDQIDKEGVLDKIEILYEKSRDISYDKPDVFIHDFNSLVSGLLTSFATEKTKILIAGNTNDLWEKVRPTVRYELEHILQELMVNMRKHSKATKVSLRFKRNEARIYIYYSDNGIGLTENTIYKNGLNNTGNRIEAINGVINFETKVNEGLKIEISFPLI